MNNKRQKTRYLMCYLLIIDQGLKSARILSDLKNMYVEGRLSFNF